MKTFVKEVWVAGATALAITTLAATAHAGGTDILHFSIRENFQDQGVEPGSGGSVQASQNKQGKANNQKLDIAVNGLTATNSYDLFAVIGDNPTMVLITNFTTDNNGQAA